MVTIPRRIRRWLFLVILPISFSCASISGPYSAYQADQALLNQRFKNGKIPYEKWLDQSDNVLRSHYRGDFRIDHFIAERKKLLELYRSGGLSETALDSRLREKFEPIREEREARYYAELPVGEDKLLQENLQDTTILLNSIGNLLSALRR